MKALSDLNLQSDKGLSNSDLFPKFCFFIEFIEKKDEILSVDNLLAQKNASRLIVTDKYLTDAQKKFYEKLFNSVQTDEQEFASFGESFFEKIKKFVI